MNKSTFSIIGERYLDTEHDQEYIAQLEMELRSRGVTGFRRMFFEYLAASGLWWNIMWWECFSLDEKDVREGWRLNAIIFGFFALLLGIYCWIRRDALYGAKVASISLLLTHIITTGIGFSLRNGAKVPVVFYVSYVATIDMWFTFG